jgi:hypothetical protein
MSSTALTIAIARDPKRMVHSRFIRKCVVPVSSTDDQKERAGAHLRWVWFRRAGALFLPAVTIRRTSRRHTKYAAGLIAEMRQNRAIGCWLKRAQGCRYPDDQRECAESRVQGDALALSSHHHSSKPSSATQLVPQVTSDGNGLMVLRPARPFWKRARGVPN